MAEAQEMTESQLIAALQAARTEAKTADGALTTQELMERLGWSSEKVRKRLRALKIAGKLEVVKVTRYNLSDAEQLIPGYRIIDGSIEGEPNQ